MAVDFRTSDVVPPHYSPSLPPPDYCSDLSCEEIRGGYSFLRGTRCSRSGAFTKRVGSSSVVLYDQKCCTTLPFYGRESLVRGHVLLGSSSDRILEVTLQLKGRLASQAAHGGYRSTTFVDNSHTLWTSCPSSNLRTPESLPFSFTFPSVGLINQVTSPLPPSYHCHFSGPQQVTARVWYSLVVTIVKSLHSRVPKLTRIKTVYIPIQYRPRSRPHRPIIFRIPSYTGSPTQTDSLDPQWRKITSTLKTHPTPDIEPVLCHFYVPESRVYSLSDRIPFRVEIEGTCSSLQRIFPYASSKSDSSFARISVSLIRQVSIRYRNEREWRSNIIGEACAVASPPSADSETQHTILRWKGEVQCNSTVSEGGFCIGEVAVKDFISVSVAPSDWTRSPLLPQKIAIPIKVTTDTWSEGRC